MQRKPGSHRLYCIALVQSVKRHSRAKKTEVHVPSDDRPSAVVTGAAGGIGYASAARLSALGYRVACLDSDDARIGDAAEQLRARGGTALPLQVDVTTGPAVATAFEAARSAYGPPTALVHCAGILHVATALDLREEDWRRVIDVNLTGTFLCDQAAARMMSQSTGGSIVNIASVHSLSPGRGVPHYDASKAGVAMLTKSLALELAPRNIKVNAVAPGLVTGTRLVAGPNDDYLSHVVPRIPLQRAGTPEDVAGAVAYLCSQDGGYLTGTVLCVDGGILLTAEL